MKALIITDLHFEGKSWHGQKCFDSFFPEDKFDLVVSCGDNAEPSPGFDYHKRLFEMIRKKVGDIPLGIVLGNHEIWKGSGEYGAEEILFEVFPKLAKEEGVVYLEEKNLKLKGWTFAGTYGHYDYSFFRPGKDLTRESMEVGRVPVYDRGEKLVKMRTYADFNRINLKGISNPDLCNKLLNRFDARLPSGGNLITLSHTLPAERFAGKSFDETGAYAGSNRLGEIVCNHYSGYHFCGHSHSPIRGKLNWVDVINIGSNFKVFRYAIFNSESSERIRLYEQNVDAVK